MIYIQPAIFNSHWKLSPQHDIWNDEQTCLPPNQELEDAIYMMKADRTDVEEKSLFVFEENEDHLRRIHECEAVSVQRANRECPHVRAMGVQHTQV